MKATPTFLLESLSNRDITFFIPPYQRNYEWSTDTCKVFLADVRRVARSNEEGTKAEHFFGSVVYVVDVSGFGIPDKYVLTDGQQRITTTMLFLMALRDSLEDKRYAQEIQKRYVENERVEKDTEFKIKLKQVESDWEAYKALALERDVPAELKSSTVYQNHQFFFKAIEPMPDSEKKSLLEKGLTKFSIISIQLEPDRNPWENPQEIFESMNSLGKPLSLADLVRNYLLMGKNSDDQTKLYNEYWLKLEKRLTGKLSEFIRDWMQADQHKSFKVARENNYKELYSAFKDIVAGRAVEDLFEELVRFSLPYSIACGDRSTENPRIDQVISDLNIIGVAPAYSYLTELLSSWEEGYLSDEEIGIVLASIRSYLLRRRVMGITQAENKMFPVLGSRISELVEANNVAEKVFEQLSSYEYALRLPNDDEFGSRLATMNFYNLGRSNNYPRLLLSIAEEILTRSRPNWNDSKLQLEHIMPQKLSAAWKAMLGEDHEIVQQEFVNNIGNITLIRHNQELGNRSFDEKKITYSDNSGLQVAQNWVLDCQNWDANAIIRRRDKLVELIVGQVLPISDKFKRGSNWKQDSGRASQFDSRQVLSQLIGETIQYIPNPTLSAVVVSNSEVEFEGRTWKLSPLTRELKSRVNEVSKNSTYQGAMYWSWDDMRLVDLDL